MRRPRALASSRVGSESRGAAGELSRALLLAFLALSAACGSSEAAPGDAIVGRLERLAFVPAGKLPLQVAGLGALTIDVPRPLLVDMFETTRAEWKAHVARRRVANGNGHSGAAESWPETTDDWPASYMTQHEASEYAVERGMRLPTAGEWLFIACGPQRFAYPWGSTDQRSIANTLELGLDRPAPVGAFEAGRSAQQVYDLLGNVAEWTTDLAPTRELVVADQRVSVLGGSFRNLSRPILDPRGLEGQSEVHARAVAPTSRADDVGLRCCADADEFLAASLPRIDVDDAVRSRLAAIGQRWGRRALPLLEELEGRLRSPEALEALLAGARR